MLLNFPAKSTLGAITVICGIGVKQCCVTFVMKRVTKPLIAPSKASAFVAKVRDICPETVLPDLIMYQRLQQLVVEAMITVSLQMRFLVKLRVHLLTLGVMVWLKLLIQSVLILVSQTSDLRDNQLDELSDSPNLFVSVAVNVAPPEEASSIASLGDKTRDSPDVGVSESSTRKRSLSSSSDSGSVELEMRDLPASVDGSAEKLPVRRKRLTPAVNVE